MTRIRVPLGKFIKEYSERNKGNEDIPVYSVTNSQGFCTEYFGKEVASQDKTTYKIVPQGYFAYNPSRINVGSVDWQRYEKRVIVSPLYNVFSVSEGIDRQYLYYFLRSDLGRQMIKAKASGSVRDNLKLDMLKEMTIPDISVEQQKFCSSVLDKLHKLIQMRQQELQKLDEFIKEPISVEDYNELERIFTVELGTAEDYEMNYQDTPFGLLIRKIAKMDRTAAYAAFSTFILEERPNTEQLHFIEQVVDYVVENGYINNVLDLMKTPFDRPYKFSLIFTYEEQVKFVKIINNIKNNALVT